MSALPAVVQPAMSFAEITSMGELFAKSGYFADARSAAQAVVKIQTGRELGFPPMAAMSGVHVIEGKPSIGAHLMAAMIRRSGHYDYKIVRLDKEVCELAFDVIDGKKRESAGPNITTTLKEFVESGAAVGANGKLKSNWQRSPDDMLFARAISKGYRRYAPDLSCGLLVYTTEEMETEPAEVVPQPASALNGGNGHHAPAAAPPGPNEPATLQEAIAGEQNLSDAQYAELVALIRDTSTDAREVCNALKVPVLQRIPQKHFDAIRARLLAKKADQAKAAPDLNKLLELRGKVNALITKLNLPEEAFKERIKELYRTTDATKLTAEQLTDLERRLSGLKTGQPVKS